MRDDDGRRHDHAILAELRQVAVRRIHEEGARPDEVAAAFGLNRSTVFSWLAKFRDGGVDALRARPVPGRPWKMSESQRVVLRSLIVDHDPRQFQFPGSLWTRATVQALVRREFAVSLSYVSVGRLLRTLGFSRPPTEPRRQSSEVANRTWFGSEQYRRARATAAAAGATLYLVQVQRTRGVAAATVNLLTATGARQAVRFAAFNASAPMATLFVEFCARLLHDADTPIHLVVDRDATRCSQAVTEFVGSTDGQLSLVSRSRLGPEASDEASDGASEAGPRKEDLS